MLKLLLSQVIILTAALPWLAFANDPSSAISFIAGVALVTASLIGLGAAFGLMFQQKFVALVPTIIVSKYAILGILIFKLATTDWVNPIWLGLGFCTIALGGLIYALDQQRQITA